jgi:hypothetical protein
MADTGAKYPGTAATSAVNPEDDVAWEDFNNIKADDGSESYAVNTSGSYTQRLKATNFGFSLPAGATINGIKVEIDRCEHLALANVSDYRVQLLDASGLLVGNNKASGNEWETSYTVATYGGAEDTWNATPTKAMVEDADFGVVLSVTYTAGASYEPMVDFIRMTVYYTIAAVGRSFAVIMG